VAGKGEKGIMMTDRGKGLIAINAAVFLFGTAGLFGKLLIFSPLIIVLGRVTFASLALLIYLFIKRERILIEGKRVHYLLLIFCGVILAIHWLTFFHSIQVSTVAIGLLSFSTFPIYVALLEPLIFREKLGLKYLVLALISLLGIRLLVPEFELANQTLQGVLWGSLSGLLFALLTILNRRLVTYYKAEKIAFYQNVIAMLFLLPLTFRYLTDINSFGELGMLIVLGIVFTALSHTLFIQGLKNVSARTASIIACLEPVYGIVFAMLVIREIPGIRTLAGGVIIIAAVLYVTISLKNESKLIEE